MRMLIEVQTPGNGRKYEILLDDAMTVGAAKEKIIDEIISFESGCIDFGAGAALFDIDTGMKLDDRLGLRSAGVRGGQTVILL